MYIRGRVINKNICTVPVNEDKEIIFKNDLEDNGLK